MSSLIAYRMAPPRERSVGATPTDLRIPCGLLTSISEDVYRDPNECYRKIPRVDNVAGHTLLAGCARILFSTPWDYGICTGGRRWSGVSHDKRCLVILAQSLDREWAT